MSPREQLFSRLNFRAFTNVLLWFDQAISVRITFYLRLKIGPDSNLRFEHEFDLHLNDLGVQLVFR